MTTTFSCGTGWLMRSLATGWMVGARFVPALIRLRNLPASPPPDGRWSR